MIAVSVAVVCPLLGLAVLLYRARGSDSREVGLPHLFVAGIVAMAAILAIALLRLPLVLVAAAAIAGYAGTLLAVRHWSIGLVAHRSQLYALLAGGAVMALVTVLEPIRLWDPRSIWYFHAKIIYFEQAFPYKAWMAYPAIRFSHVDYPKLLAVLAALAATLAGYWNEYVPQFGLVFIWGVALTGLFGLFARVGVPEVAAILGGLFLLSLGRDYWAFGGYMDVPLAAYVFLGWAYLVRFLRYDRTVDLLSGAGAFAVCAMLKNEGLLVALCVALVAGWPVLRRLRGRLTPAVLGLLAVIGAPIVLWLLIRTTQGIAGDDFFSDVFARLQRHGLTGALFIAAQLLRVSELWGHQWVAGGVFIVSWGILRRKRWIADRLHWLPVGFAVLYLLGVMTVYMLTPYNQPPLDLAWHVQSSFYRVLLTPTAALLAATYVLAMPVRGRGGLARRQRSPVEAH